MTHQGTRKRARRGRNLGHGQSLVEFALVLPVFLLILTGIIDFGFMLYSRMTVINATREGARAVVTMVKTPMGIPATAQNAVVGADTGLGLVTANVAVTCVAGKDAQGNALAACDFTAGGAADPVSGDIVNVTTTYTYHSFFASFFGATIPLVSSVQMVIE